MLNPVIIDLEQGNMGSVINAFNFIGVDVQRSHEKQVLEDASHLILSGVGAFDAAVEQIDGLDLREFICDLVLKKNKPLLGICVGMQLLFEGSEEGSLKGLGFLPGKLKRLQTDDNSGLKVPHVGFSKVALENQSGFFQNLNSTESFYFTHSYALDVENTEIPTAICDYGFPFVAGVKHRNIHGLQFHPEKSQSAGLQCLVNFFEDEDGA